MFEGVSAKVPYAYVDVLAEEYSEQVLLQNEFHDHTFVTSLGEWQKGIIKHEDTEEQAPKGGAFS